MMQVSVERAMQIIGQLHVENALLRSQLETMTASLRLLSERMNQQEGRPDAAEAAAQTGVPGGRPE